MFPKPPMSAAVMRAVNAFVFISLFSISLNGSDGFVFGEVLWYTCIT